MMQARRNQLNNPKYSEITTDVATPLDILQIVVVDNHSIAPESRIQPNKGKLGKHYYKPSLRPLDPRIWKSDEINWYV